MGDGGSRERDRSGRGMPTVRNDVSSSRMSRQMADTSQRVDQGMRTIADVGAAVIGTGFIGTVHVEALRRIGVQVRGVLGSTPERGEARASALGVPRAYPSLEALLDDPAVDAVHVTSPNDLRLPQTLAILAA